jgi:hypothetical protein
MLQVCSVYSQLLQLFSRAQFARAVKDHKAERNAKGFSSREQFVAMLFCQLAHLNSLREVCMGLASCESPLKHLGISTTPKRSTLAYANANRPWEAYESIFMQLLEKCQMETAARSRRKFRFKNKLMSLDASVIELSSTMFDWAQSKTFRTRDSLGCAPLVYRLRRRLQGITLVLIGIGLARDMALCCRSRWKKSGHASRSVLRTG